MKTIRAQLSLKGNENMTTPELPFNVLIVEDTIDIANLIMMNLQRMGLGVAHVNNGLKAVEFLQAHRPDLLVLDLNLPGMNGWQVLEHAKQYYGEHQLRVIVTTAAGDASNRLVGKLQYVDRYLTKPFTPNELMDAVREVLELDKFS